MTLEDAALEFFTAIREAGRSAFGHEEFGFQVNISLMIKVDDAALAPTVNAQIQAALDRANAAVTPIKVSLQ